jgi:hypothetical protein
LLASVERILPELPTDGGVCPCTYGPTSAVPKISVASDRLTLKVTTQRPSAWLCVVRFNLRIVEVTEEC